MRITFQRGEVQKTAGSLETEGKTAPKRLSGRAQGEDSIVLTGTYQSESLYSIVIE